MDSKLSTHVCVCDKPTNHISMEEHSKKVLELGGKIVVLTIENSMFGLVGTSMLDPDGNHLGMLEYMQKP